MCSMSCDNVLTGDVIYASQKRMPLGLPPLARLCYVGGFHLNGFHSRVSSCLACTMNEVHQIANIFRFYDGPDEVCELLNRLIKEFHAGHLHLH